MNQIHPARLIHFLAICLFANLSQAGEWVQVNAGPHWSPRFAHTSVVFQNKMWVMGGVNNSGSLNDVWSSNDGINWTESTGSAPWSPRYYHSSVVFDNKIWVIGGWGDAPSLHQNSDVWSSSDGTSWTLVTASAAFGQRAEHASIVFNNKMWVVGGMLRNDVWSSSDGAIWEQATAHAQWPERSDPGIAVFNNQMWIIGGVQLESALGDVWSSSDGVLWTQSFPPAPWHLGRYPTIILNDRINLLGGYVAPNLAGGNTGSNRVYSTADGAIWYESSYMSPIWSRRHSHTGVVFDNKVWIMGGRGGPDESSIDYLNDIWYIDQSLVPVEVSAFTVE